MSKIKSLLVYCGASAGVHDIYREITIAFGKLLVKEEIQLVYGGGSIGLMGILADTVLAEGGKVTGVIPGFLNVKEVGHSGLTKLHVVNSMHERKALMEKISDGAVALPGGFGTLDETFEMLTWSQLGLHRKPVGLLNVNGFYNHLSAQLDVMVREGFVSPATRSLLVEDGDPLTLITKLREFESPYRESWMKKGQE